MSITCCYNCEERILGCHDKCEKYKNQKEEIQKKKEYLDKNNFIIVQSSFVGSAKNRNRKYKAWKKQPTSRV